MSTGEIRRPDVYEIYIVNCVTLFPFFFFFWNFRPFFYFILVFFFICKSSATRLVFPWPSITPESIRFSKIYNLYSLWPSQIQSIFYEALDVLMRFKWIISVSMAIKCVSTCIYNINIWALVKIRMLLGTYAFRRCCIPPFLFKRRKIYSREMWLCDWNRSSQSIIIIIIL